MTTVSDLRQMKEQIEKMDKINQIGEIKLRHQRVNIISYKGN